MAWFKKKRDPISERARELKKQIAQLEGEIRRLSSEPAAPASSPPKQASAKTLHSAPFQQIAPPKSSPAQSDLPLENHTPPPKPTPQSPSLTAQSKATQPTAPGPRLRSTARPQSPTVFLPKPDPLPPTATPDLAEENSPIFEEVGHNPFRTKPNQEPTEPAAPKNRLDIRRNDLLSIWKRFKSHFRGPATSNPKLVNYLAAGSIQGLRPLRYERRVARNRFLALVAVLILVLWGIVALIFFR